MKNRKKIIAVVTTIFALTLFLCVVPAIARYITKQGKQNEIDSENFYFTSNYLKSDEIPEYEMATNSVALELRNYEDALRTNESDIQYTISADAGVVSKTSGTLTGGNKNVENITLSYSFSDTEDKKEIIVTVNSTSPYTKEMKAKFILVKPVENLRYEIKDNSGKYYAELYIYMPYAKQNVTIEWDKEQIVIDETNDYVFGKLNADKNSVAIENIDSDTTVKIVFFKKDINKNYSCGITEAPSGEIVMPAGTAE
ncbi:MAG: hypothetical protein ACI39R_00085 [Lachnospiraceae bacterium]